MAKSVWWGYYGLKESWHSVSALVWDFFSFFLSLSISLLRGFSFFYSLFFIAYRIFAYSLFIDIFLERWWGEVGSRCMSDVFPGWTTRSGLGGEKWYWRGEPRIPFFGLWRWRLTVLYYFLSPSPHPPSPNHLCVVLFAFMFFLFLLFVSSFFLFKF